MFEKKVRGLINQPCDMDAAIDKIVPWLYDVADKVRYVIGVIVVCFLGIKVADYLFAINMNYGAAVFTIVLVDIGILAVYHTIAKYIIGWLVGKYYRDKFMDICEDIIYENGWYTGATDRMKPNEEYESYDSIVEFFKSHPYQGINTVLDDNFNEIEYDGDD